LLKNLTSIIFSMFISASALALNINNANIEKISINRGLEQVFVLTSNGTSNGIKPGCKTDGNWDYTFSLTTEIDKALYSSILAALATKSLVSFVGYADCLEAYSKVESLNYITVNK
jgi:hypothetical protein